jgi:transposase
MAETLTIISERVDDIPLLVAQLERMGVPPRLDEHFPTHGNWVGLRLGWVSVVWLTHMLSQAHHRLNHVEPWAAKRLHMLRGCIGQRGHPWDVSDDRLAAVLEARSEDVRWRAVEGALTQQLLRVYALEPERVRLESTTASGYWRVTAGGLFQFGHSQDHRPDLPQVKVLLSALDPGGLPVATDVVSGPRADAPLYIPAVTRGRESLGRRGRLYVGDGKMGALETGAFRQAGGDYDLCPLSAIPLPTEALEVSMAPVWAPAQAVTPIRRPQPNGKQEVMGEGDERLAPLTALVAEETVTWLERRLVIRSHHLAQTGERALHGRLAKAPAALAALQERRQGKKRFVQLDALREAADAILQRYPVPGLLSVRDTPEVRKRPVRRYGKRPATVRVAQEVCLAVAIDQEAVQAAVRQLGWRVYATNAPVEHLSLTQAVRAYRSEYLIERGFGRLQGQPRSLSPMSVERDDHATGLIRLLAVGLRVLTLMAFVVRRHLATTGAPRAGL